MKLEQILRLLRTNWKLLAVIPVVGLALAAAVTSLIPNRYSTSTSIYISAQYSVGNSQAAYQASLLSEQRVTSYSQLLVSDRIGQEVSRDLAGSLSADQALQRMSVVAPAGSVLLTLTVTDTDPVRAAGIANVASQAFIRLVAELETPLEQNAPPSVAARIVEPAVPQDSAVSPRWSLNLSLGLILGLVAALLYVLLKDTLDTRIKTSADFANLGLTDLGEIGTGTSLGKKHLLPTRDEPHSSLSEEYRKARTNLEFVRAAGRRKVIAFSSALPGEGKTTTCCNLAISVANTGLRVLLIDADLRKPRIAEMFGAEAAVGLTSVLIGKIDVGQAVQASGTINLDLLASGPQPPNPSELLGSASAQDTIESLSKRYDLVLIDTPPLLPVTDASVVSAHVDGVVVVCRLFSTTISQFGSAVELLRAVGVDVVGAVGNMGRSGEKKYGDSYYGTYGNVPSMSDASVATTTKLRERELRAAGPITNSPSPGPRNRS